MNPFDIHGPAFLGLYCCACIVSLVVAFLAREVMRRGDQKPNEAIQLHPYEIAYLNGGSNLALQTAMSYLILKGVASVEGKRIELDMNPLDKLHMIHSSEFSIDYYAVDCQENIKEFESQICTFIHDKTWPEIESRKDKFKNSFEQMRKKLADCGLAISSKKESHIKMVMIVCLLLPPLCLALPRIIETFSTHKPVMFLVIFSFFSLGLPLIVSTFNFVRTPAGDKYINQIKDQNMGLYQSTSSTSSPVSAEDLTLAVGLFVE